MSSCTQCETVLPGDSLFCPRCGTPAPGADADDLLASSASDPSGLLDRLREATAGEFKIIRELGRGGMGRVYLAHESALDRRVALKVLPPNLAEHAPIVMRFQREAQTAGKLTHPHIVSVYKVSEREGLYFFTMPFVPGPSLRQVLRKTPELKPELTRRYLREACDALGYAHGQGVIHRDIKPENMLIEGNRDGRLMLTDFGIAKALGVETTLTRPGDMMGTPYFMSPEQCEGTDKVDGRSDQYSLGLVAYEMLAGRFPFNADSMAGIIYKHLHEYPEPLDQVRPGLPRNLQDAVERAIRKNPDERFPTMHAMQEALGAPTVRQVVVGPSSSPAVRPKPKRRASRGRRFVITAGFIVILGGAAGVVLQQRRTAAGGESASLAELGLPTGAVPAPGDSTPTGADSATAAEQTAQGDEPEAGSEERTVNPTEPVTRPVIDPRAGQGREEVTGQREAARQARQAAGLAGADSLFPQEFGEINRRMQIAQRALRNDNLVPAAIGFAQARGEYESLAERARESLTVANAVGGDEGSEATVDAEPPPVPPEQAIRALLEIYREAWEAADANRLGQQVYRAPIPEKDGKLINTYFDRAEQFHVELDIQDLNISGDSARAQIKQTMSFRLIRTGDRRDSSENLLMYFQRSEDGWRLLRFER